MQSFSDRLRSARIMKGWSLQELADNLDFSLSKQALNKYELGEMKPTEEVLRALSVALGVKPDFFLRTSNIQLGKIEFRKSPKLSVKEVDSVKEKVIEFLERYLEVEQLLNLDCSFEKPLTDIVYKPEEVDQLVSKLNIKWSIGFDPISSVIALLEEKGIRVLEMDLPEEFDGLSTYVGKIPVIVISKNYTIERKRFTALHELGHLILNIHPEADKERICHAFAGAMLLPDNCLEKLIGEKRKNIAIGELVRIKEQFGISVQAIMMRAQLKGIITYYHTLSFWRMIKQNKKEEGLGQYNGVEKCYRFEHLVLRLAAEEVVSLSKAASLAGMKLSEFRKLLDAA